MARQTNLTEISRDKTYQVAGFANNSTDYAEKLHKMGFVEGTPVELAPVNLSDPMVIQIRGSRIALRKSEAQQILVREL
ncbi:MAG: FeoA family protein [Desulforhopalus sp.]